MAGRAHKVAESFDRNHFAAAFPGPDDAADSERVAENLDGLANMMAMIGCGVNIVDDYVMRPLKGGAFKKSEGAQSVIAVKLDTENDLE